MTNKKKKQNNRNNAAKLTPYQGKNRSFGFFKCPECEQSLTSAFSWANMGQECRHCLVNVYPFRQQKLEKGQGINPLKPHLRHLREKCQKFGRPCDQTRK